jgi:hypothetical protein
MSRAARGLRDALEGTAFIAVPFSRAKSGSSPCTDGHVARYRKLARYAVSLSNP